MDDGTPSPYESRHQIVERLLQRAEALKAQCEAAAAPEETARLMREWNEVMLQAKALLDGKTAVAKAG